MKQFSSEFSASVVVDWAEVMAPKRSVHRKNFILGKVLTTGAVKSGLAVNGGKAKDDAKMHLQGIIRIGTIFMARGLREVLDW